jgi:glycosyltransferase involved in cell wall biosynthesis
MILYFHTGKSSFVNSDMKIISQLAELKSFGFVVNKKIFTPFVLIQQLIFIIKYIFNTRIYITQFAGYHSLLPALIASLTGRKCLIISAGMDCVSFPGIGYGNFNKPMLRLVTKLSFQNCSHISPKHESLIFHQYSYDINEPSKQGIKAFLPNLNKEFTIIYNGYDANKWVCTTDKISNSFITLCGGFQYPFQIQLKGIDLILKIAPLFPQCTFTIAGVPSEISLDIRSANVNVLPPQNNHDLSEVFSHYEFYLQLSMAEGFPNALCEAMLCECIPIVSDVFSMPEIVGESGYILRNRNSGELKDLILKATSENNAAKGKIARQRIADNYTLEKRRSKLLELINTLTAK